MNFKEINLMMISFDDRISSFIIVIIARLAPRNVESNTLWFLSQNMIALINIYGIWDRAKQALAGDASGKKEWATFWIFFFNILRTFFVVIQTRKRLHKQKHNKHETTKPFMLSVTISSSLGVPFRIFTSLSLLHTLTRCCCVYVIISDDDRV
jgi:hypothetical protein